MAQLAPLLGQLRLAQTLMMFPLSKISVLVHAKCWYRPVSTTGLPTARGAWRVSRRHSGFSIVSDGAKRQLMIGPRPPFLLWKKFLLLAAPAPESRPVFSASCPGCKQHTPFDLCSVLREPHIEQLAIVLTSDADYT